jgi:hypothetical protein
VSSRKKGRKAAIDYCSQGEPSEDSDEFSDALVDPMAERLLRPRKEKQGNRLLEILDELERSAE